MCVVGWYALLIVEWFLVVESLSVVVDACCSVLRVACFASVRCVVLCCSL